MKKTRFYLVSDKVQEMSSEDVKALVGKARYEKVKAGDEHPFFIEMVLAHEGLSKGRILQRKEANKGLEKWWSKEKIYELVARLSEKMVPVYLFHNQDNSPRKRVGEVLSAVVRQFKGKLSALAIAYISEPEVRRMIKEGEIDTCSLEAELAFVRHEESKGKWRWVVNAVEKVTGIALGSTMVHKPGFDSAGILASVQEYDEEFLNQRVNELEERLRDKERELAERKEELERLKMEKEREDKIKRAMEIGRNFIRGRNLSEKEDEVLVQGLKERIEALENLSEPLDKLVEDELSKELKRLERFRKIYRPDIKIPNLLEQGTKNNNPLIPRD